LPSLVLDNPTQNRLSTELLSGFGEAVRSIAENRDVRAVLVRAEGENFSFGGDISTWLELTPEQMRDNLNAVLQLFNAFENLPVPVVAAVLNGPTLAHAGHKRMLNAWANGGIEAADKLSPELAQQLIQTDDARRGIASAQDAMRRGIARPVLQFQGR
jgi:hypothetical protein